MALLQLLIKLMPTLYTHALHIKHSRSFEEKGSIAATSMSFNPLDSAPCIQNIRHSHDTAPAEILPVRSYAIAVKLKNILASNRCPFGFAPNSMSLPLKIPKER